MRLIQCPACTKPLSKMAEICPSCGHPVKRGFLGRSGKERAVNVGCLLILIIVLAILLSGPKGP